MTDLQRLERKVNWLFLAVLVLALMQLASFAWGQSPASEVKSALAWAEQNPQRAVYTKFLTTYNLSQQERQRAYIATSYSVNLLSSAGSIVNPEYGKTLIAVDMSKLWPVFKDLDRAWRTWEGLADTDPYFHQRATVGKQTVTVHAGWIDPSDIAQLQKLCGGSSTPILRADWFIAQVMQAKTYYSFRGINENRDKYLAGLGLDARLVQALRVVRAANIPQSGVTHQLRRVTRWPTPAGSIYITFDSVANANAEKDPFHDPTLGLKFDASELIATQANGLHEFTLFLANGKRADVVDPALAIDDSGQRPIPLAPPLSCIKCHGTRDGDVAANGLRSFTDAQLPLIAGGTRTIGSPNPSTVDQIASLYYAGEKLQRDLNRDRTDYAAAVSRLSMPLGRPITVAKAAEALDRTYTGYVDSLVSPASMCRELGLVVTDSAVQSIREIAFESNSAPAKMLCDGLSIQRSQSESVFDELSLLALAMKGGK